MSTECKYRANMAKCRKIWASVKEGRYTSLGSYPKCWETSDGAALSYRAMVEEWPQIRRAILTGDTHGGWHVFTVTVNWEDPALYCDHTGERIESAYAEDEAENPGDSE